MTLRWRTELAFYERRTHILRRFEEMGSEAFRWHESTVGARLAPHCEVEISATGATVRLLSPHLDASTARQALGVVMVEMEPSDVVLHFVGLQYLLPIPLPFETAAVQSAESLVSEVLPDAQPLDWSVLLDGGSEGIGAFQVEYGIISQSEAEDRLRRQVGRIPSLSGGAPGVPPDLSGLPECAHFFDWSWHVQRLLDGDDLTSSAVEFLSQVEGKSQKLSDRIRDRFGLGQGTVDREAQG